MAVPVLLVLAGPAGSGKTTLCERAVRELPGFSRVVTTTTRPPRPGEVNGVHYHFLSPAQFDERVAAGAFLEWAWVHQQNRYGTLASSVMDHLAAGSSLIINVRRAAAADPLLRRHLATVFINVPLAELRQRMIDRGQDSAAEIERRLGTAQRELAEAASFDYGIESRSRDEDFAALVDVWRAVCARVASSA
jgi:guanylate kinase